MKVDIVSPPPPLPFGEGEDEFKLKLKRWDGAERAAVFDAIMSGKLLMMQAQMEPLVIAWENVCHMNGTAIPLDFEDEKRRKCRNFDLVIGQLSLAMQMRVLGGIAEFIGVPANGLMEAAGEVREKIGDLRPTGARVNDTPATASGG